MLILVNENFLPHLSTNVALDEYNPKASDAASLLEYFHTTKSDNLQEYFQAVHFCACQKASKNYL